MGTAAAQPATVRLGGSTLHYDAGRPVSLAAPLDFAGGGAAWFPAPPPRSEALQAGGFTGCVATGASCNGSTVHFTPHCDGTHTECVGHLTLEHLDARDCLPPGLLPALLLQVATEVMGPQGAPSGEGSRPVPLDGDRLVTCAALAAAWPEPLRALGRPLPVAPRALLLRTGPGHSAEVPAYLTLAATEWLVERGIEHLLVELPSVDRVVDDGQLAAHRVFFGLPPGSCSLAAATRSQCTITELAVIPATLAQGFGLLALQAPALAGDALPSRPLWHPLLAYSRP
jgi:hypothetical protein